ncbi:MAG: LPS-assembly protein LptD, partial [Anaeromyxobacteraceae bacterium]
GVAVETELSRRFGALRQSIVPRLAWRVGSGVLGGRLPGPGYDGWDRAAEIPPGAAVSFVAPRLLAAAPPGSFAQGRASVETRLDGPVGELLHLELGQDFDLGAGELADAFATLRASAGPFTASASAGYAGLARRVRSVADPSRPLDDWTEVRGSVSVHSRRGHEFHAGLLSIGAGGAPSGQGGADALFDLRPTPFGASSLASAGFRLPIGPATIGYDLAFPARDFDAPRDAAGNVAHYDALHVQQQTATFVWDSPCRCFRASAYVRLKKGGEFDTLGASIDLSPGEPVGSLR